MTTSQASIVLECIQMFKEFPCLWDNRQVMFTNKEARDKAYEILHEKYKLVQPDITIPELKKKFENMRTTFRREHKKVLISRMRGDYPEYKPTLFYYEPMLFLNEVLEYNNREIENFVKKEQNQTPLRSRPQKRSLSSVYLPESYQDTEEDDDNQSEVLIENFDVDVNENEDSHVTINNTAPTECVAFGTTVGLQLKELDVMQRTIAEKLISDVIFNGRLRRLSMDSCIQI